MAELIYELIPTMEVSRLVDSGTEAVMSAIRVARGYTGRDKIISNIHQPGAEAADVVLRALQRGGDVVRPAESDVQSVVT